MDHFFAVVLFPNSELLRVLRNLKLSLPFSGNLLDMSCRYIPSLIRNAPRLKTRGIEILRDPRTNKVRLHHIEFSLRVPPILSMNANFWGFMDCCHRILKIKMLRNNELSQTFISWMIILAVT